ncbi:MprA protease, GlyGly-CTERM protein-sorting domain-containing form [Cupriavidus malaysiensis]|uniref:MprA protease, GlyGly-CTERM protein-sorting domain-containing form n=1 Tax=Cupriavidus malaysiensis TaxID=367825 RepID=UPI000A028A07|nr:MprA protease, GlyGly-CTERM protein-sorting domain-containing form [Cupriavidus malaysiensis]
MQSTSWAPSSSRHDVAAPWRRRLGQAAAVAAATVAAALLAPAAGAADGSTVASGTGASSAAVRYSGNFIVRWRDGSTSSTSPSSATGDSQRMLQIQQNTGVGLSVKRQMGGSYQLMSVAGGSTDPEATAAKLRQDPRIAEVVPDRWLHVTDTAPNDPYYASGQYPQALYMGSPSAQAGAANLPKTWDVTQGSSSIVVAVVDTGYLPHPDLAARLLLPGYNFVSANGATRSNDATDPGDYIPANYTCPGTSSSSPTLTPSSWHGTRVASVIGAVTNNNSNIAGVDWNARIVPVRVAGQCGALLSDTVDGMRWAGGLSVPGVPNNANPARVINISLGGGTCSQIEQQAVNDLTAKGVVVIAAAGNNGGAVEAPGDCSGVIAVTAHVNNGEKASYASYGSQVALSAPGGGCGVSQADSSGNCSSPSWVLTLSNSGQTTAGSYNLVGSAGTSFAAPMTTGVVSLMLAANGALTPAQVASALKSSARAFPGNTFCATNSGACGAGLLDAFGAVTAAGSVQSTPSTPTPAPAASGGGGGGGAVPPWTAALLAAAGLLAFLLRRRR